MTSRSVHSAQVSVLLIAALLLAACGGSQNVTKPQPAKASEINLELGIDALRKNNLPMAKEKLDRAVEQNPRNASAQAASGLLYDRLGEYKKAEKHFDRAVSLDPENADIMNNFAAFLCKNERFERGEKLAAKAATKPLYRTPEVALLNAGNCARSAKALDRAEQYYRASLQVRPRFAPALLQMADVELGQKNYMAARAFLERYSAATQVNPASLWLGVRIERGLGNQSAATGYAMRLKNEYPTALETKALIESERNPG